MSALRPGSCVGLRVWILLAMTHLTLDFSLCSPLSQGLGIKLIPKPVPRPRLRSAPLWDTPNMLHWRTVRPLARRLLNPVPPPDNMGGPGPKFRGQKHRRLAHKGQPCKECRLKYTSTEVGDLAAVLDLPMGHKTDVVRLLLRARRQLKWDSDDKSQDGRTTTVAGYIDWGPTGTEDNFENGEGKTAANSTLSTKALTTTMATTTTTTTTKSPQRTFAVVTTPHPRRLSTTKASVSLGETVKPPKPYGDTPGKTPFLCFLSCNFESHSSVFLSCFKCSWIWRVKASQEDSRIASRYHSLIANCLKQDFGTKCRFLGQISEECVEYLCKRSEISFSDVSVLLLTYLGY